jgi:hypothetical protein
MGKDGVDHGAAKIHQDSRGDVAAAPQKVGAGITAAKAEAQAASTLRARN